MLVFLKNTNTRASFTIYDQYYLKVCQFFLNPINFKHFSNFFASSHREFLHVFEACNKYHLGVAPIEGPLKHLRPSTHSRIEGFNWALQFGSHYAGRHFSLTAYPICFQDLSEKVIQKTDILLVHLLRYFALNISAEEIGCNVIIYVKEIRTQEAHLRLAGTKTFFRQIAQFNC